MMSTIVTFAAKDLENIINGEVARTWFFQCDLWNFGRKMGLKDPHQGTRSPDEYNNIEYKLVASLGEFYPLIWESDHLWVMMLREESPMEVLGFAQRVIMTYIPTASFVLSVDSEDWLLQVAESLLSTT